MAVIGAGVMGHGIAQALASGGSAVLLADRDLTIARSGKDAVAEHLCALVAFGHVDEGQAKTTLELITPAANIADAVARCGVVIEAVPEVMATKQAVWREINRSVSADALLATNTSSFDIDAIAAVVDTPSRLVGTHWYNPPYLVPCVEVIRGTSTSDDTVAQVVAMLTAAGKLPLLTANSAGFVGNRLQFALIAEAFRCLEDGVASAEDIDRIVKTSFGMRLAEFGPFELADLGGLDTYQSILRYLTEHLGPRFTPPQILDALVEDGRLGLKTMAGVYQYSEDEARRVTAERDRRLAQRAAGPGEERSVMSSPVLSS